MRKFFYLIILFLIITPSFLLSKTTYDRLHFNVYRNDSKIGYHNLDFSSVNDYIESKIEIKFEVTFLGFVVYDYFHKNHEKWEGDTLVSMNASTDKNGELLNCSFSKEVNSSKIQGTNGNLILENKITPTTYWYFDQLIVGKNRKVLNTQDCSFIDFKIEFIGDEMIYNNSIMTSHYKLTGKEISGDDVDIDIWYKDKKWGKMIFVKDGSEIEYFLKEYDEK